MRVLRSSFAALLLLAACDVENCLNPDGEIGDVVGGITGYVCDEANGPLSGVEVTAAPVTPSETVKPKSDVTVADGSYNIKNLAPGEYVVTYVDGDGASVTLEPLVTVTSNGVTGLTATEACRDRPPPGDTGAVEGTICNRHVGSLVAGADVIVKVGTDEFTGTTDAAGHFRVDDVTEGEGTVTVSTTGFQRTWPITVVRGQTFEIEIGDDCDVPDTSTGCFTAYVCDEALGRDFGLGGAEVKATFVETPSEVRIDRTDDRGFSEICALTPGIWRVDITPRGSQTPLISEEVDIVAAETRQLRGRDACGGRTEVGRVEGSVCNEGTAGGVFVGTVELRTAVDNVRVADPVTTDAEGNFAFEGVPPGEYVLAFPNDAELAAIPITVTAFQTTALVARNCPLPGQECTPFTSTPEETADGRIYFIVDKSGSMNEVAAGFGGNSKWEALKAAVNTVTQTLTSGSIDYALAAFPNPTNTRCELDTPDDFACTVACAAGIEVGAMGQTSGGEVNQSLANIDPFGGTPTSSTLRDLKTTIEGLAAVDRPLAVVLATDGAPNCAVTTGLSQNDVQRTNCAVQFGAGSVCTSTSGNCTQSGGVCNSNADCRGGADTCDLQRTESCAPFNCLDLSAINRVQDIARLGVKVHVVGINAPSANPAADPFVQTLNAMAVAGGAPLGGTTRFHAATDTAALQNSLRAITRQILACSITTTFDLADGTGISVKVGDTPILRNTSRTNGWDIVGPRQIQLFGAACDRATENVSPTTVTRCTVQQ